MMKSKENAKGLPITLQSAGPIDDCGRRWNIIYWILGAAGGIFGFLSNGFGPLVGCALIGLFVGWVIKSLICRTACRNFRSLRFSMSRQVPYAELTTKLIPVLTPLGMSIENDTDGSISISYKGLIYDVSYENETTFHIWWRTNIARALLGTGETVGTYRKVSQAMGIIAWNVQQISAASERVADAADSTEIEAAVTASAAYARGDQNHNTEKSAKKKFIKPLIVVVAALVLVLGIRALLKDDSMGISDMIFDDMTISMGDAVKQKPFCDAKWYNDEEGTVWLTFNDQSANAYEICFSLFDNDTQARIDAVYFNDASLDNVELTYLLEYLDSGDYDTFKEDLSAYGLLSYIFS